MTEHAITPAGDERSDDGLEADAGAMLADILERTQRVQALIEAGDWLGAAEVDVERQGLLMELCARIEPRTCPPELLAVLTQLVTMNDAMLRAVEARQDALRRDAETIGVGRRAVAAYGAVDDQARRY